MLGRFVNQKIKVSQGIVTKNDFRQRGLTAKSDLLDSYNGEDDRSDQEDEASQPLITNHADPEASIDSSNSTYARSLAHSCMPLDLAEWRTSSLFNRALLLVKAPVMYLLKLTIPLVDYDLPNSNWNKATVMVNCLVSPLFMVLATRSAATTLLSVPLWAYTAVLGALLCALVFFLTDLDRPPRLHWAFAYFGFAVSIVWIYSVANEIVNLLTTFGVILNISNTILGLTFLAWGNSLSGKTLFAERDTSLKRTGRIRAFYSGKGSCLSAFTSL